MVAGTGRLLPDPGPPSQFVLFSPLKSQEGTHSHPSLPLICSPQLPGPQEGRRVMEREEAVFSSGGVWGSLASWGSLLINCCSSPAVITNKKLKSILPPGPWPCPRCSQVLSQRSLMQGAAETHGRLQLTVPHPPPRREEAREWEWAPALHFCSHQALVLHILPHNPHSSSGTPKIWGLGKRSLGMQIEDLQLLCPQ